MENKEKQENGDSNPISDDSNLQNEERRDENIDENKLRGDAIGNTVYSERYVLETLLKLKDMEWNKELEDDLCCIWDMTLDKDVVDFLLDNNFIDFAIDIIKQSNKLRLIEILVGIIGNLCIHQSPAEKTIENEDFEVLLSLVFSDDPPTLIQLMRLLKSLLYKENIDCNCIITEDVINQINFILRNAKNSELLGYTLQVTGEITSKDSSIFLKVTFLDSIAEAFKEIINDHELDKHLSCYLKVIENACTLLNEESDRNKLKGIINNFSSSSVENNLSIFQSYLENCLSEDFILNESNTIEYFIYCSANFLISFQTKPNTYIFKCFIEIFQKILDKNLKETFETDVCEYISNYLTYFIEFATVDQLSDALKGMEKCQIKKLFVEEITEKYDCTKRIKSIINELCT